MIICITGGTGLVGVNLVHRLAREGHELRLLVRAGSNVKPFEGIAYQKVVGDITDRRSVRRAIDGCEVVFHLAGFVNMSPFLRRKAEEINVHGTENVVAACLVAKVRRLVHTSSIAAIGYGSKEEPADENSYWNFSGLHGPYYDTKRAGEQHVLSAVQTDKLDAVVVNPGYILGPWDMKPSSGRLLILIAKKRLPAYPLGGISVAHVDDIVQGHIAAMEKGHSGRRYILAGENLSYKELMTMMAEVAGVAPPRLPLPRTLAAPLGWCGDLLGHFWPHTFNDFNSLGLKIGAIGHYVSSEKAKRHLSYQPQPARRAVEDAYAWFIKNKYL